MNISDIRINQKTAQEMIKKSKKAAFFVRGEPNKII